MTEHDSNGPVGRAWVFGDNIDTDVLAPGRYMHGPAEPAALPRPEPAVPCSDIPERPPPNLPPRRCQSRAILHNGLLKWQPVRTGSSAQEPR